jgi:ABC-type uncharacterized transport system ATPase subunit
LFSVPLNLVGARDRKGPAERALLAPLTARFAKREQSRPEINLYFAQRGVYIYIYIYIYKVAATSDFKVEIPRVLAAYLRLAALDVPSLELRIALWAKSNFQKRN